MNSACDIRYVKTACHSHFTMCEHLVALTSRSFYSRLVATHAKSCRAFVTHQDKFLLSYKK